MTGRQTASKAKRTQERIVTTARQVFAERGFEGASVRFIAAQAAVDQALVHRYFGTKEALFLAATDLPVEMGAAIRDVLALPDDQLGSGLVRAAVNMWDSDAAEALISTARRIIGSADAAPVVRDVVFGVILSEVPGRIEPTYGHGRQRVALVASQMVGLLVTRKLVGVEPLQSISAEQVAALIGPTVQHYLTGDMGPQLAAMGGD